MDVTKQITDLLASFPPIGATREERIAFLLRKASALDSIAIENPHRAEDATQLAADARELARKLSELD